uniref:Rhodanese domain-containing protein n=1 Tax=Chromera velia CCMP2878 TaxID=1169474 RepID=A0A0G4HCB8_9ALVE|eukprot:Cvel_26025.t1-p1 / transcript=Cvel_26025.t1 / gene=Cvel_26025 / organism=Chromera_velia_CCMP2878 / gene_product=Adenylyltransferase and sulfurtransferase MOCS3, putative / transcript_product=Adenylyltransferase and sulfurtransferase MOCS3, putative / location=Cvel_scaffold3031:8296-12657(+) / protein_length=519 / sequence_SO=supercontig / SO=protein_coding / is_pseudo=false
MSLVFPSRGGEWHQWVFPLATGVCVGFALSGNVSFQSVWQRVRGWFWCALGQTSQGFRRRQGGDGEDEIVLEYPLSRLECARYGRQMILPEVCVSGQIAIRDGSVLVIGAGGLGSPALLYLAAAGIGRIGIVDGDTVDASNLHRQVIHQSAGVGMNKAESAADACRRLNPHICLEVFPRHLDPSWALEVINKFDIVVDATDNAPTRYLINDACVLSGTPLVSGSALRWEGQLSVLHLPTKPGTGADPNSERETPRGPCYRCLFPSPPVDPETGACDAHGVVGPAPGVIGVLQALEALKVLVFLSRGKEQDRGKGAEPLRGLLLFDGADGERPFRCVRMRGRRPDCTACGDLPAVKSLSDRASEYAFVCGSSGPLSLPSTAVMSPDTFLRDHMVTRRDADGKRVADGVKGALLVDVRPTPQHEAVRLPGAISIPLATLKERLGEEPLSKVLGPAACKDPVILMCRRGIDSATATQLLLQTANREGGGETVQEGPKINWRFQNLQGGLTGLQRLMPSLPVV